MAFIESPRFPTSISFGSTSTVEFSTSKIILATGATKRNRLWTVPIHIYDISYGVRVDEDIQTIIDFFFAMGGPANSFRYKDWADCASSGGYKTTPSHMDQVIGVGDGSNKSFQLIKTYTKGSLSTVRPITKPVSGTVMVSKNGVLQSSGWSVDTTTGLVTFVTAPASGVSIRAGFFYDVPVAFVENNLEVSLIDKGVSGTSIMLREELI